jgi:hypothetical protein
MGIEGVVMNEFFFTAEARSPERQRKEDLSPRNLCNAQL